jgi:hypothetical protein
MARSYSDQLPQSFRRKGNVNEGSWSDIAWSELGANQFDSWPPKAAVSRASDLGEARDSHYSARARLPRRWGHGAPRARRYPSNGQLQHSRAPLLYRSRLDVLTLPHLDVRVTQFHPMRLEAQAGPSAWVARPRRSGGRVTTSPAYMECEKYAENSVLIHGPSEVPYPNPANWPNPRPMGPFGQGSAGLARN